MDNVEESSTLATAKYLRVFWKRIAFADAREQAASMRGRLRQDFTQKADETLT